MKRNRPFEAIAGLVLAFTFWRVSVAGVTTGLVFGGKQVLPAGPVTALGVLGGGILGAYLLLSIGRMK